MVMVRPADDVGVPAVGQLDPLDGAELEEEVERAEYGRPAESRPLGARLLDELRRGEGALARGRSARPPPGGGR
jgi:hypothetical protein